ncbi:MAG TPA: roadblock/LC7 domain-containing protein [Pseudonocardia sp.]|nr:roadblock/LC7 domain-containing protein [Pseudonocardia sp.]
MELVSGGALDWLLVEFVRTTPGTAAAIVVSADGLPMAYSPGTSHTLADQLSAATAGLVSLSRGTAALLGSGPVTQTILEMAGGYLFVTAIGDGAALAVHSDRHCDIGMVGYEMTLLADRVGHAVSPAARADVAAT